MPQFCGGDLPLLRYRTRGTQQRARRHLRKGRRSLSTDEIATPPLVCRKDDVLEVWERAKTIELP